MARRYRWLLPIAGILLLMVIPVGWVLLVSLGGEPDYRARAGDLVSWEEDPIVLSDSGRAWEVSLHGEHLSVQGRVRAPAGEGRRWPALLILGGLRTGRRTVDYIDTFEQGAEVLLMALDYPYEGPKSNLSWSEILGLIPRIRGPCFDTPAALLLAVDYLRRRPEVDPNRIVLVGGSLGAIFVPAAGAQDPRPAAVVMIYGLGDLRRLLEGALEGRLPLPSVVAWMGDRLLGRLDPVHTVPRISPRPLLMVNALGDERIPTACVEALHRAAPGPCTKVWLPISHASPRETREAGRVYAVVKEWLEEQDILH